MALQWENISYKKYYQNQIYNKKTFSQDKAKTGLFSYSCYTVNVCNVYRPFGIF